MRKLADGRGLLKVSPTTLAVINGEDDLSMWTDDELEYGAKRGKDGRFRKKPRVIAQAVHDELVKRKMSKAYSLLKESTYDAVRVLVDIAKDTDADAGVRVKAAELLLDRTLGKAPQHLSLDLQATLESPAWMEMFGGAVVGSVEQAKQMLESGPPVIDVSPVENDES